MSDTIFRCPCCGQKMEQPETMKPAELRAIRGIVGVRLDYDGPMPRRYFCHWLYCSERSLLNYETGASEIPPLVAKEARRLREDHTLKLPTSWKRKQTNLKRRKEHYSELVRRRKMQRKILQDAGQE